MNHIAPSAVAPAPCGAPTLTRRAGATAATLSSERVTRGGGSDSFRDIRIHIARDGQDLFHETVPPRQHDLAFGYSRSTLTVRDLDGDGEPEVMLLLSGNCSRGCPWSRIYRYDRARSTYVVLQHCWGSGFALPRVRDLDADGRPEFVSQDEQFTGFTNAGGPLQIWSYRRGVLHDVTRRRPGRVRRDAAKAWRLYRKNRGRFAREILPIWMGDEYLLGHQASADRTLERIAAQGRLRRRDGEYGPRSPWAISGSSRRSSAARATSQGWGEMQPVRPNVRNRHSCCCPGLKCVKTPGSRALVAHSAPLHRVVHMGASPLRDLLRIHPATSCASLTPPLTPPSQPA